MSFQRGQFHVFPGHIQTSILSKPVINCELRGSKFFNIPIMALTEINRTGTRHYELKLEVFSKCADEGKQEFLTEVNVLRTEQQASFSVGKDSVGCTDDPDPFVITLNNLSEGDSLAYTWTVTPQQGVSFAEGDTNSESPKLLFSESGDYDVRLAVSNGCHHDDDSVFRIKAFAIPRVRIGDIADQCEPFHFIGRERRETSLQFL